MTDKESFLDYVGRIIEEFDKDITKTVHGDQVRRYWKVLLDGEETDKKVTENGQKILIFMQENEEAMNNIFTSKEIAEALFVSGRSISGSMRKLFGDGYINKEGNNPVKYSLTDLGRNLSLKNWKIFVIINI